MIKLCADLCYQSQLRQGWGRVAGEPLASKNVLVMMFHVMYDIRSLRRASGFRASTFG
ncbi:hypothetical protein BofuT4_P130940.1 [Botrytis cinerea T4]|uniref:Uncharacterized protein n=1 Tax=Botryotinia fuckeliana (strain T4) TaxID=999810 RepID=G2YQL6_BOTF4|nr:hypothetical protein BofuT4_P130940.1 [Botrytis cinerea T4]